MNLRILAWYPTRPRGWGGRAAARSAKGRFERILWGAMLAVHTPALAKAWAALLGGQVTGGLAAGCASLTLSAVFFVFKMWGGRALALRTDGRALLVVGLALVLIHAGPLGLRMDSAGGAELPMGAALLLAGADGAAERLTQALRGVLAAAAVRPRTARASVAVRAACGVAARCVPLWAPRPPPR